MEEDTTVHKDNTANTSKNKCRIIIIDDNPQIHRDIIKILTTTASSELDKIGKDLFGKIDATTILPEFEIDTASQGQEGVKRIQDALKNGNPYSLAFVDIRMPPGWDGVETIKHIWALDPDVQVVICTAYSDYSWEETITHLGQTDNLLILKKPFDDVSVRQIACALTKKWQLVQNFRSYASSLKQQVENKTLSLQQSLSLIQATLESSSEGILVIDNKYKLVEFNQKLIDMWQLPKDFVKGKSDEIFLNHLRDQLEDPEKFNLQIKDASKHTDEIYIDIIKLKDGRIYEYYSSPYKLNGKNVGRVYNFRDITKHARLEQELQQQATHDSLTGLGNRVMLLEKLRAAIKTCEQNQAQFALLFFDLDRFKLINDSLSHAAGDHLLQIISERLQAAIREGDTIARLGGDEFIVILMNVSKEEDIIAKIHKLQGVLKQPVSIHDREILMTASIGVSIFPKDGLSVDALLRNADAAMYRAKAHKGDNYQFYSVEMSAKTLAMLDQEIQLRQAIANNEFFLHYQPQVDLNSGRVLAVEALLRWQHPQKGVLLPMDFVLLAENIGLINTIGEWVIRTACAQNKVWQDAGLPHFRVAVNITAEQIKQPTLIATVCDILKETKLSPEYLELELTENIIISNSETIRVITELKKIGVTIAIDDFGTGYSSLSYLHKIPLDRLKIDGSFVKHIQNEKDDDAIIRAIIAIAKSLDLDVLAEGVETQEQINFLKKNRCLDIQGFYFSKPLAVTELENYVKNTINAKVLT